MHHSHFAGDLDDKVADFQQTQDSGSRPNGPFPERSSARAESPQHLCRSAHPRHLGLIGLRGYRGCRFNCLTQMNGTHIRSGNGKCGTMVFSNLA
jgi:hypothetical protein